MKFSIFFFTPNLSHPKVLAISGKCHNHPLRCPSWKPRCQPSFLFPWVPTCNPSSSTALCRALSIVTWMIVSYLAFLLPLLVFPIHCSHRIKSDLKMSSHHVTPLLQIFKAFRIKLKLLPQTSNPCKTCSLWLSNLIFYLFLQAHHAPHTEIFFFLNII